MSLNPARTTGVRRRVLAALCLLSFVTIIDRVCISAAKSDIAADLRIPDLTFGIVFGAFALGYALFMIPAGWTADRLGARRFLAAIVGLWSLFTLLTGMVTAVGMLIVVRFLFGAAEAGAYPTAARAIRTWLPRSERGLALGLLNTGSRLGAAVGLSLVSAGIAAFGWRACFAVLGAAGIGWAGWWLWWYRDDPSKKAGVSSRELEWIRLEAEPEAIAAGADWRSLVSWDSGLLLAQYFASNFTFFLCFSWLLPYLRDRFGLGLHAAGLYASVPLYFGALATWMGGWMVDAIYRRGRWKLSRRLPATLGFALAALTLVAASYAQSAAAFVACFALTTFGVDFTLSPSWSAASDLGGSRTATLSAAMNMFGSLGSFASSVAFPWLLSATSNASAYFVAAAALDVAAVLMWLRINCLSMPHRKE